MSIPFDFLIDGEVVTSGKYIISRSSASGSQGLSIGSADGRVNRSFNTSRAERETPQAVRGVFHVYGDQHFLSQVFWPGNFDGFQLGKCKAELALEAAARRDKGAPQVKRVVVGE